MTLGETIDWLLSQRLVIVRVRPLHTVVAYIGQAAKLGDVVEIERYSYRLVAIRDDRNTGNKVGVLTRMSWPRRQAHKAGKWFWSEIRRYREMVRDRSAPRKVQ